MGPGQTSSRSGRFRESAGRPGQLPVFYDGTDPRLYRHAVVDWLAYQNCCTEGDSDYMSHEKRLRALINGIRGCTRRRLDNFVRVIPSSPSAELFTLLVDHLLQVVDPIDRRTDFLATADAWKNLANTRAKPGQSLAQYWLSFTNASVQYTQLHGDVAGTVGCQELIALTCLHNVGLPRGEFNVALQDALRWQEGANRARQTGDLATILKGGSLATYSGSPPTASEAARSSQSASSPRAEPTTTAEDGGGSGSTEKKIDIIAFETALRDLTQQHQDVARIADKLQEKLTKILEAAPGSLRGDLNQSRSDLNRMKCHFDVAVTANDTLLAEMPKVKEVIKELQAVEEKGKEDTTSLQSSREPLITLDAVRVALRALEAGERRQKSTATSVLTEVTRRSGRTTRYTKLKCFECGEVGHKWWQKPQCKRKHDKRKEEAEKEDNSAGNSLAQVEERGSTESRLTNTTNLLLWDDTTRTTLTDASEAESLHPIIDGGAKRSVIGLPEYVNICEELSISPKVHPRQRVDPEFHAFGTSRNSSERQRVAGRVNIPIPYGRGRTIIAGFLAVDGNVPPLIGKDLLREWRAEEDHAGGRIKLAWKGEKVSLRTYLDETGHARLPLSREALQMNIAESMLFTCLSEAKEHVSREESIKLLKRIHSRTHAHWTTIKILLERNRQWHPGMLPVLKDICKNCAVCIRTGDPQPSRKISLSRLHMGFNDSVAVDFLFWKDNCGVHPILHAIDEATGYSELELMSSRDQPRVLECIQDMWMYRHGEPRRIKVDREFDKPGLKEALGVEVVTLPARRHSKQGQIERKNRVVKDALEKLSLQNAQSVQKPLARIVKEAAFVSNILYGNQVASAFELARGFTPAIGGSENIALTDEVRKAQEELDARRRLARINRARPLALRMRALKAGQKVLILLPGGPRKRGQWKEATVSEVREDGAVVCGRGRSKKVIAPEDVRSLPQNALAIRVVKAQQGVPEDKEETSEGQRLFGTDEESSDEDIPLARLREPITYSAEENHAEEVDPTQSVSASSNVRPEIMRSEPTSAISHEDSDDEEDHVKAIEEASKRPTASEPVTTEGLMLRRSGRTIRPPKRYALLTNPASRKEAVQKYFQYIHERKGTYQFMRHELREVPAWIFEKAYHAELQDNWKDHIKEISWRELPNDANVISSHLVYKIKPDPEVKGLLKLKARLCVHGNRDKEKDYMRSDAAVASHEGFRLLYSLAARYGFCLGKVDIRGAYSQSGEAIREIYLIPPREMGRPKFLWRMMRTMYGIVSAGRKWQRASDSLFTKKLGLRLIPGMPQMFCNKSGSLCLIVCKYVDDILIAASTQDLLQATIKSIQEYYDVSKISTVPELLDVNSTDVEQSEDYSISVSMESYLEKLKPVRLNPSRRRQVAERITQNEERMIRALAGTLGYMGTCLSPFALFAGSFIQQCIPRMTISGIKQVNAICRSVSKRSAIISYVKPHANDIEKARIIAFSDAGFPHRDADSAVAQEGVVVGIGFGKGKSSIFHPIFFSSRKQRRSATSSVAAETIAATSALGSALALQRAYEDVTGTRLPVTLAVDSKGLHEALSTEHNVTDKAIRKDVDMLRRDYEAEILDEIVWIPGCSNPADALTKGNAIQTGDLLEMAFGDGVLPVSVDNRRHYGPALEEEL